MCWLLFLMFLRIIQFLEPIYYFFLYSLNVLSNSI
nr:MAG TPA: hypothetical protein [Caudoviricetes sp.]